MYLFALLSILSCAVAFNPIVKEGVIIAGSTAPLENFDPLGFSEKKDIAYLREAELKHGRWAMIGTTSILLLEQSTHRPAIHEFQDLGDSKQLLIVGLIAAAEFQTMLKGWRKPWVDEFTLKDDYQPGDLGFALPILYSSNRTQRMMNRELNNGRLAMIGFVGMLMQELVTNQPL